MTKSRAKIFPVTLEVSKLRGKVRVKFLPVILEVPKLRGKVWVKFPTQRGGSSVDFRVISGWWGRCRKFSKNFSKTEEKKISRIKSLVIEKKVFFKKSVFV